jgi:hypothetical protein
MNRPRRAILLAVIIANSLCACAKRSPDLNSVEWERRFAIAGDLKHAVEDAVTRRDENEKYVEIELNLGKLKTVLGNASYSEGELSVNYQGLSFEVFFSIGPCERYFLTNETLHISATTWPPRKEFVINECSPYQLYFWEGGMSWHGDFGSGGICDIGAGYRPNLRELRSELRKKLECFKTKKPT